MLPCEVFKGIFWDPWIHRSCIFARWAEDCRTSSQFWQWPAEGSFCSRDFPREQKVLRAVSMPTDLWAFLRAFGLLWIALDSQLEMKDSHPNSKMPGEDLGWKVLLFSSLLLCLISVVLFLALWFDPDQQVVTYKKNICCCVTLSWHSLQMLG